MSLAEHKEHGMFGVEAAIPDEIRRAILAHFRAGYSMNHVVYLMGYEINVDDANRVVRERLKELES